MSRRGGAAAALAVAAAVVGMVGPAHAGAPTGACPGASGVTVVVDYGLPRGVEVRCAPGDPETGLDALTAAGFSYTFVPRQPGMVCQIDGTPDPCNGAPTSAYWAYHYAGPGGSGWTYSQIGAGARDPEPGDVEGWAFGAGREPAIAPPAPAPTTTAAPTTVAPGPTTAPPAPNRPGGAATTGSAQQPPAPGAADPAKPAGGDGPADDAAAPGQPTEATTSGDGARGRSGQEGSDRATGADGPGDDEEALALIAERSDGGGGAPLGTIAGIGVVAGVGLAGVLVGRRRQAVDLRRG